MKTPIILRLPLHPVKVNMVWLLTCTAILLLLISFDLWYLVTIPIGMLVIWFGIELLKRVVINRKGK